MKILCNNLMPANKQVNKLANYLYKTLPGAYNYSQGANQVSVFTVVYYQIPHHHSTIGKLREQGKVEEVELEINFATYQNKVRVNVIVNDENEFTLSHFVLKPEDLINLNKSKLIIITKISDAIEKEYEGYDVAF